MTGLDIPIEFMNIEELARRWKCTLSTIESLAETDKLKFCLRPAALEVALARIPLDGMGRQGCESEYHQPRLHGYGNDCQ